MVGSESSSSCREQVNSNRLCRFGGPDLDEDDVEDLEEAPEGELESAEEEVLDQATAARSIVELRAEIETLRGLESLALDVRRSGTDTKWHELASLLNEIFASAPDELGPVGARIDADSCSPSTAIPSTTSNAV